MRPAGTETASCRSAAMTELGVYFAWTSAINAKIAVLYQNDDFGKDYLNGLRDGLGDKAA